MKRTHLIIPLAVVLCACTHKEDPRASLPDMSAVRANLAFTCTHESDHLPPLDPKADIVFRYARYLQKTDGPKNFDDILRYYRIAVAYGHYKANGNAQLLISQGLAFSPEGRKKLYVLRSNWLSRACLAAITISVTIWKQVMV